jgi:hypothetical protein
MPHAPVRVLLALAAALVSACGAAPLAGAPPEPVTAAGEWIDSHACPHPGTNRADPSGWDPNDRGIRRYMLGELGNVVEATLLLTPYFLPASLVAIARKEPPPELATCPCRAARRSTSGSCARPTRTYGMMEQSRPHGDPPTVILSDENLAAALERVHLEVRETRAPIALDLATRLIRLWHAAPRRPARPARARYASRRTKPSGVAAPPGWRASFRCCFRCSPTARSISRASCYSRHI